MRANGLASARITLGLAFLLAVSTAAIVFCANVISDSAATIHELTQTKESREQAELIEIAQLFQEHENFVGLVGRRGHISRHSLAFMHRCRRELQLFGDNEEYQQAAPGFAAESLLRLAQLESLAGNTVESSKHLRTCVELADQAQDMRLMGYGHNALGVLESGYGKYTEAVRHFEQAVILLQQLPQEREMLAQALRNQSIASSALNSETGSLELTPLVTSVEVSDPGTMTDELAPIAEINIDCKVALAHQLEKSGQVEEARKLLQEAMNELDQLVAICHKGIAEGDVASARKYVHAIERIESWSESLDKSRAGEGDGHSKGWPWLFNIPTHSLDLDLRPHIQMCAEFDPQSALMVAWSSYDNINQVVSQIIRNTREQTQLVVVVSDEDSYYEVVDFLVANDIPRERIRFSFVDIDSCWLRDLGPIAANDINGNSAWFDAQIVRELRTQNVVADALPSILNTTWNTSRHRSSLFLEGGAILSNGKGITVCSSSIPLINKRFGFTAASVVSEIERVTGANNICFVEPLEEEPTGHIDMFMTIPSQNAVVVSEYADKTNRNAAILDANARKLAALSCEGEPMEVFRVPVPDTLVPWANYTNVVYANGVLLVPSWRGVSEDIESQVKATYQKLLPDWKIVSIDCSDLANTGGALHCLTSNLGSAVPLQRTTKSQSLATDLSLQSPR